MILVICSRAAAEKLVLEAREKTALISITSTDEEDAVFAPNPTVAPILRLKLNDLTNEYDEEGLPYGRPVPKPADLAGLKEFADHLRCERLILHCWEGTSRSAAVAAAIWEYRGRIDTLRTGQRFAPNPLIYELACRALGIRPEGRSVPPLITD